MTATTNLSKNYTSMKYKHTMDSVDEFYNNNLYGNRENSQYKTEATKNNSFWKNFFKVIGIMSIIFLAGAIAAIVILKALVDLLVPLIGPIITGAIVIVVGTFLLAVAIIVKIAIPFI